MCKNSAEHFTSYFLVSTEKLNLSVYEWGHNQQTFQPNCEKKFHNGSSKFASFEWMFTDSQTPASIFVYTEDRTKVKWKSSVSIYMLDVYGGLIFSFESAGDTTGQKNIRPRKMNGGERELQR